MNLSFYHPASAMTFDDFTFDPRTLELRRNGAIVPLQQQPARVLGILLARRGELVTREELRREIWGDETFVDFNRSLNFCVSQVRAALGDDPDAPRFVETLRGRGYRFVAASETTQETASVAEVAPPAAPSRQNRGRRWALIAAVALVVLAPVGWSVAVSPKADPRVAIAPFDASAGSEDWSRMLRAQIVAHLAHGGTHVVDPALATVDEHAWRLDARVDRSAEQYRVTVMLHDPSGAVRFTDIFDGPPGDWIEAQNEMARIISQAVRYNVEGPQAVGGIERRAPRRRIPFS